MPTLPQIRGMLLEEVLLHLLRGTGYRTVDSAGSDPTLRNGHSGLEVCGRGSEHQIDAVADFKISHPFSHPHRLLVEAKCHEKAVIGIEIPRNAVGVLKDVSEFWVTAHGSSTGAEHSRMNTRYHYQYALFSVTPYSRNVQQYAFAQDIYLIALGNSRFFEPIVRAIRAIERGDLRSLPSGTLSIDLKSLRHVVRQRLKGEDIPFPEDYSDSLQAKLLNIVAEAWRINYALLAVFEGGFPVFLVPASEFTISNLNDVIHVRIRWDENGWYIDDVNDRRLFSFDLPQELFNLYASRGSLRPERALQMKEDVMHSFYAFLTVGESVRVIGFLLDTEWTEAIRRARQQRPA